MLSNLFKKASGIPLAEVLDTSITVLVAVVWAVEFFKMAKGTGIFNRLVPRINAHPVTGLPIMDTPITSAPSTRPTRWRRTLIKEPGR